MSAQRRRYRAHGWLTHDGELTEQGERRAEYEAEARNGYWDVPGDDRGPDGHGWAPEPFPESAVI